jgi:beta-lactamase superfamily II metal-dependent hydrolase
VEVCFVDVAQGSSSVILLGGGRAILIDCGGRQARTVLSLLSRFRVTTIERLIVTHNHADHSAGAAMVLTAYRSRVEQIWMVFDSVLKDSLFWARVNEEIQRGRLESTQVYRLEYRNTPTPVFRDTGILLQVIAPTMQMNIQAVLNSNPNATSGVLVLKLHDKQIVFAGDSTIPQWRAIRSIRGRPIKCHLLTLPHHAGKVWEKQTPGESDATFQARLQGELNWLYTDALNAEVGVVSAGTSNSYHHPRAEVIDAFRRNSGQVFCTQMTAGCEPDLETQRRRALPIVLPSRSSPLPQRTPRGASSNVACGGTLLVEVLANRYVIHRFADHQAAVDRVPAVPGQRPLCRR